MKASTSGGLKGFKRPNNPCHLNPANRIKQGILILHVEYRLVQGRGLDLTQIPFLTKGEEPFQVLLYDTSNATLLINPISSVIFQSQNTIKTSPSYCTEVKKVKKAGVSFTFNNSNHSITPCCDT